MLQNMKFQGAASFVLLMMMIFPQVKVAILQCDMVPITNVQNATLKRAVCLDGSPASYYYAAGSEDGTENWMVYMMGGGWCAYLPECQSRTTTSLGSTNNLTTYAFGGILSSDSTVNPDFHNWNRVVLHYCDGASFMGDFEASNLQFRGSAIFNATLDELLLLKGMKDAKSAILVGASAGGLATILHCDQFRASLPNATRLKCLSDAGFFIRGKDLPRPDLREKYFAGVVQLHNLTTLLPSSCTSRSDPNLCLFAEYLVGDVQTPLFLLNTAFDNYQIRYHLKPNPPDDACWEGVCAVDPYKCSPPQKQLITDFGNALLAAVQATKCNSTSRGMFINACFAHDYSGKDGLWNSDQSPKLMNMTVSEAVGDWYYDRRAVQLIDTDADFPINCTLP